MITTYLPSLLGLLLCVCVGNGIEAWAIFSKQMVEPILTYSTYFAEGPDTYSRSLRMDVHYCAPNFYTEGPVQIQPKGPMYFLFCRLYPFSP